jgi:hypothetical protein
LFADIEKSTYSEPVFLDGDNEQGGQSMAYEDVGRVMAITRSDINGIDFAVLIVLAWHKHEKTGQCNPSYETIARESHSNRDTVYRRIQRLKKLGVVSVQPGMGRTNNWYVLNLGVGSEPSQSGWRAHSAYVESLLSVGGELPEQVLSVPVSESGSEPASVSVVDGWPISVETQSRGETPQPPKKQEQGQKQEQQHGEIPVPPFKEPPVLSNAINVGIEPNYVDNADLHLLSVWKQFTTLPGYQQDFTRLLKDHDPRYISAVICWSFNVSNYWSEMIMNSGYFRSQFLMISGKESGRQYEQYLALLRAGAEKKATQSASRIPTPQASALNTDDEAFSTKGLQIDTVAVTKEELYTLREVRSLASSQRQRVRTPHLLFHPQQRSLKIPTSLTYSGFGKNS